MEYLHTSPTGRRSTALLALLLSLVLGVALIGAADAHAGQDKSPAKSGQALALQWFDLSKDTVAAAGYAEPITASRAWAVSWIAATRAVGDGRDQRFRKAAFATALHDTLLVQVPSRQPQLDAALAATLGAIPDGKQKSRGVAAGAEEAERALAEREGDGLDTASVDVPWTPPPAAPGVWQPTPPTFGPAVRAGQKDGRAFLLASNDQFRPGPPPAIDSPSSSRTWPRSAPTAGTPAAPARRPRPTRRCSSPRTPTPSTARRCGRSSPTPTTRWPGTRGRWRPSTSSPSTPRSRSSRPSTSTRSGAR